MIKVEIESLKVSEENTLSFVLVFGTDRYQDFIDLDYAFAPKEKRVKRK